MASFPPVFLATMTIYFVQVNGQSQRYLHNLKVPYFSDVEMYCDHMDLNISTREKDVQSLSWIFPDGRMRDVSTYLNYKMYEFTGVNGSSSSRNLTGYTLKAFNVDQDLFGYYTCIVVLSKNPISGSKVTVVAIRWGLNVHGADFSELMDTYKENAIIGGIAAAVTLVLIAGGCLIWHYCIISNDDKYSDRDVDKDVMSIGVKKNGIEMHENSGYATDKDDEHVTDISVTDSVQF